MKIIFLGLLFCEDSLKVDLIKSKKGTQYATHNFQSSLISGFKKNKNIDLTVYNIPPTGSYPFNHKELFFKKYQWGNNLQISFLNLPIIKHYIQKIKLYKIIKKKLRNETDLIHFIIYSPYIPFLKVYNKLKRKFKNINCSLIVTDPLPGKDEVLKTNKLATTIERKSIFRLTKNVDYFIPLTKYLNAEINVYNKPSAIIECISDFELKDSKVTINDNKVFMYSGAIYKEYGIIEFAKAFEKFPNNEFWIFGTGPGLEELKEVATKISNLKIFGFVENSVVAEARENCDFLVNPRRPTGTFTKYSFPSKTVEYMISGKPVIMYKLEGVPDEYDQYLNYFNGTTSDEISLEISKILEVEYNILIEKAKLGQKFINECKNSKIQAMKIITMLEKGEYNENI